MKIICGLGNPGREYAAHRHNVGFRLLELLSDRFRIPLDSSKFEGRVGLGALDGDRLLLLQPQTFMNLSGRSLAAAARFYKVPLEEVLVMHDELDLPYGRFQLKQGGGAGGHNGLRSLLEDLGEDGFVRLRLGVGKPEGPNAKERVVGHVLAPFSAEERSVLDELLSRAADAAELWVRDGLAAAMNAFNRRG